MISKSAILATGLALLISFTAGCDSTPGAGPSVAPSPQAWLGVPSMVNRVIEMVHDGTGWLLNKSQVSVKKTGEVRPSPSEEASYMADYQITVTYGEHSFETTAIDIPCDRDGIPTEASVDRMRGAVEDIKTKMKRLQQ